MTEMNSSYNYVVCGAGSAGSVVAARLSEDETISVLLLEAGPSDKEWPLVQIPLKAQSLQKTDIDWSFKCEPQSLAYKGIKDVIWPRGKVLGGCSSINHMAFTRCSSADYDSWAKQGCTGWSWKELLPYFLKTENCKCPNLVGSEFHNTGGPMTLTNYFSSALSEAFIEAGVELGFKRVDINCGDIIGFGEFTRNIDEEGKRVSTATAYIHPTMARKNLTVLCNAHVTKIDIVNNKAVGVYFHTNDGEKYVGVDKEVIVSGGAVNSPQLLMLSGIGPKEHLQNLGIQCIADLPVGKNLQDHLAVRVQASVKRKTDVDINENFAILEATAFVKSGLQNPDNGSPDIQFHFLRHNLSSEPDSGINKAHEDVHFNHRSHPQRNNSDSGGENERKEGFSLFATILHPNSTGEVRLRSRDPFDPPIIDPNYLDESQDVKVLIKAIRVAKEIIETEAMKPFESRVTSFQMPDGKPVEWSDEDLEHVIRHFALTLFHPTSTCKMGAVDDPTAVVDPQLRVIGIKGLRVIDASIMPDITSGNTNAPTIMIGEKGADLIINC